jgi:hypothetical protein
VTLHLTAEVDGPQANSQGKGQGQSQGQGQAHAHFAPNPPSYHTAAGNIKSKAQKSSAQKDNSAPSALKNSKSNETNGSSPKKAAPKSNGNDNKESSGSVKLAPPLPLFNGNGSGSTTQTKIGDKKPSDDDKFEKKASGDHKQSEKTKNGGESKSGGQTNGGQSEGKSQSGRRAQSVMSTRSRKSRYGGDEDAEPMHVVHKRNWEAVSCFLRDIETRCWWQFHANSGVRTIVGEVGGVPNGEFPDPPTDQSW